MNRIPPSYRKKFHWLVLYGILCVLEFIVGEAKDWVEEQIIPPKKPKTPPPPDDDEEDDDDEEETPEEPERRP